jgi:hypothetical protein
MMAVEPSGRESVRGVIASRSHTTAAAALVLASAVGWLYAGIIPPMVRQWATDADYSHGFFVVPLALYFAWEKRAALRSAPARPSLAGLAVLAASLVCFVAGQFGAELFLSRVSLIGVIAGLVLFKPHRLSAADARIAGRGGNHRRHRDSGVP